MTVATLALYQIVDELQQIGEVLEENGGELTPEITVQLDALEGALTGKVERIVLYMRNLDATAAAADSESMRLAEIGKRKRGVAARLKEYLKAQLELAGIPKVETPLCVVRLQRNSRPSISCAVPIEQLPEGFIRIKKEFDKDVAYELWKSGAPLPEGVLVEVGSHLRVN